MNVADLTAKIEALYPVGESTASYRSVTGEPYVVIGVQLEGRPSIPGTVDEGVACKMADDEETACQEAWSSFLSYLEPENGVLYWRVRPVLEWSRDHKQCVVYMRLLISNRIPVKHAS